MKKTLTLAAWFLGAFGFQSATAQTTSTDSILTRASLQACIDYALGHQPLVRQSLIDQEITERDVRSALSAWYPQLAFNYNVQHFLKLPVTLVPVDFNNPEGPRRPTVFGVRNSSNLAFSLNQNLFSRDVLLASRTADAYRAQAGQTTVVNKIDVVVNVSKAYYDVILTERQVDLLDGDIARLQRSLQDATNQYQSGIVDRTDPQRARINLNNTVAQRRQTNEQVNAKYQTLKQLMGYPPTSPISLAYDTLQLANEIRLDTNRLVTPQNRIEYQLLQTQSRLLDANLRYTRQAYLPVVAANANYVLNYQNNTFAGLYTQNFPNSLVALTLSLPIFEGGRRTQEIRKAELQIRRLNWDVAALSSAVDAEYAQALANYKGNLANYNALQENLTLAEDVYRIINLQYRSGIRAYLDVLIAETDLRTARIAAYNALFQVLSSKLDVQRALGDIRF